MAYSKTELAVLLALDQFPRSASYDPEWVLENLMGPNVLWLTEALSQVMSLKPGMRVLDMGCGRAISSIFLAKEFGLQVWATDLWISASNNWQRVSAAGVTPQVFPIHAEAHALPFAEGFFDALVSLDAYHYFGTDDLYLGYYSRFVQAGGQIGIVVPGLRREFTDGLPAHLAPSWHGTSGVSTVPSGGDTTGRKRARSQ
jgi:cyclopropane fatty-acyl-phospholipid synthase-like methyltransferase